MNTERPNLQTPAHRIRAGFGTDGPIRRWGLAVVVLLALVTLVHPEIVLRGDIYRSSDASNATSFQVTGDAALAEGAYPQWNPYIFGGMPTFGSLAYTRFLYPPSELLTRLQDDAGFPLMTWMLAHLLLGGIGMIWLLGRWDLPWPARLLGAAIWLLMPKIVAWGVHGHGSKLMTAMYLPWVIGLTLEVLRGRGRRTVGGLALLLGLQILCGHIQIIYYTLLAVGLVTAARWIAALAARPRGAPPWRETAGVAVAVMLAFALGAALLLPVQEYAGLSIRGEASAGGGADYDYATGWSLAPQELPTLVVPSAAGFGLATYQGFMPLVDYPNYLGLLPLLLAAAGLTMRERWLARALLAMALLALLISFGRFFPLLYDPCYRWLPYFNKFRVPSMILVMAGFSVALLSAAGAARLASSELLGSRWTRRIALGVAGLGAVLALGGLGLFEGPHQARLRDLAAAAGRPAPSPVILSIAWRLQAADLLRLGLVVVGAGAALFAAARYAGFRTRGFVWILLILTAVDTLAVDRRITHPERHLKQIVRNQNGAPVLVDAPRLLAPGERHLESVRPEPWTVALADRLDHERIWPLGQDASTNAGMIAGVRSLGGYHPAKLAAYETIRERLYPRALREGTIADLVPPSRIAGWLAASHLTFDSFLPESLIPRLQVLGVDIDPEPFVVGSRVAYRNRAALPRARLVPDWAPAEGDLDGFLDRLQAGREPVGERVLLHAAPDPRPVAAAAPLPEVTYLVDGLNEVVLRAAPPTPAILVLADMWTPGWSVEVDGEPAPLLRADHVLRAVALPAGEHMVRFVYRDPALERGLTVAAVGILLIVLLLVFGTDFVRPRRGSPGTEERA